MHFYVTFFFKDRMGLHWAVVRAGAIGVLRAGGCGAVVVAA
jgi:hypothetical protein